jgi:vitamin B12 transporter
VLTLVVLIVVAGPQVAPDVRIVGTVRDATALPLSGATIEVDGRVAAEVNDGGAFVLVLPRGVRVAVRISLACFDSHESTIEAADGQRLDVVLALAAIQDRVSVAAPRPRERVEPVISRRPIDVYRTPGAQGDLFRALQALPGVSAPDDAAGLFVRGGDVSEVLVTLDDATMAHPYRYETPTGGFRGAVDPMQIAGLAFASGGFSARHGNALSAVLDLQGQAAPETATASTTLGLAGASAAAAFPVVGRVGIRAAVNRTFTRLLFTVNGSPRPFDPPPEGWDASTGFDVDMGRGGQLRAFVLAQGDAVGVQTERDAFVGWLNASSRHRFGMIRWNGGIGAWATTATFGEDRYERQTTVGVLDVGVEDRARSWRIEGRRRSWFADWRAGINGSVQRTIAGGHVPEAGGDLAGVRGEAMFDVKTADWVTGSYVEVTTSAGPLSTTAGGRVDRFGIARATTFDPRIAVRLALGRTRALRYATGIYRQAPGPSYFDRVNGAAHLRPMRAVHHVIGVEQGRESEGLFLRAEGYVKRYGDLPIETPTAGYASDGYGSARGVDLFAQWRTSRVDVHASASLMRARRRWTAVGERNRYPLTEGSWAPDFEIPWTTQAIVTVPLGRGIGAGVSWRAAAGRPHTPVIGAVRTGATFAPVFGARNSGRLPRYARLDVSLNRLVPLGAGAVVLFASLDNVLGRQNAFDYRYSADYSARQPVVSTAARSLYAGFTYTR